MPCSTRFGQATWQALQQLLDEGILVQADHLHVLQKHSRSPACSACRCARKPDHSLPRCEVPSAATGYSHAAETGSLSSLPEHGPLLTFASVVHHATRGRVAARIAAPKHVSRSGAHAGSAYHSYYNCRPSWHACSGLFECLAELRCHLPGSGGLDPQNGSSNSG